MIFATLKDGERVAARGGVYMRPIVRVDREDETTFVRSHRWTRYRLKEDGRTRVTGTGRAEPLPKVSKVENFGGAQVTIDEANEMVRRFVQKWPSTDAVLRAYK